MNERWPTLARAMERYEQNTAEAFTAKAYECVFAGLIRLEDRKRLGREAEAMGIRAFDAQLLMACAIRQWALDHSHDPSPSKDAPRLSYEYKAWGEGWKRFAIMFALAVTLDGVLLWYWLR